MNLLSAVGRYLLVFLLGWSGAAYFYLYNKVETPGQTTSSSESPVGDSEQPVGDSEQPVGDSEQPIGDSEQPIEEQTIDQDAQPVQK